MILASILCCSTVLPAPQVPAQSPIRYQLTASVSADGNALTGRAVMRIARWRLGAQADSLHIGLGGTTIRLRLTAPPVLDGRPVPYAAVAESTEIALPLAVEPAGIDASVPGRAMPGREPAHVERQARGASGMGADSVVSIELHYRVAMDTSTRRQLGYDLFAGTEDDWVWYPTLQQVADSLRRFSDFDVTLTAPRGVAVLMTGAVRDSSIGRDGVRRRAAATHVEGFALALARDFVVSTARRSGIVVRAISPAADSSVFRGVAKAAARAASWYHETYGFFPVAEMGIVPGVSGARGGFPLANVFMIHRGDLSPDFVRWITSHELAHYYWGLHVLGSAERLDWLMLGLGIWTDELYLARTAGVPLETQWRDPHADNSFGDFAVASIGNYDQRLGLASSFADSLDYDYNSYVRHGKGAVAMYLLAQLAGTDQFVALQRSLLEDFRYRPLSPDTFAGRLEAIGVRGARAFVARWVRGDARLDYAIRGVRADTSSPTGYWIDVERTGTIPYPVTIEAASANGSSARATLPGDASDDSVRVTLDGPLTAVRIDPDGVMPMWSSSNREMRRVFLRAMGQAGPVEPFLTLVRAHLHEDADPILASLLVERLFELGRYAEVRGAAREFPAVAGCTDRVTCLAALQVARSLARLGQGEEARSLLARVAPAMGAFGFAGSRRLVVTREEVAAAR